MGADLGRLRIVRSDTLWIGHVASLVENVAFSTSRATRPDCRADEEAFPHVSGRR